MSDKTLGDLAGTVANARQRLQINAGLDRTFAATELGKAYRQIAGMSREQLRGYLAGTLGGFSFSTGPSASQLGVSVPSFAAGGIVPGAYGSPQLIQAHGGEEVVGLGKSGRGVTNNYNWNGPVYGFLDFKRTILTMIRDSRRGGGLN